MTIPPFLSVLGYGEDSFSPEDWRVHSRFERALNLIAGDRLITICAASIPLAPERIVLSCESLDWVETFQLRPAELVINGISHPLLPNRLWKVPPLPLPASLKPVLDLEERLAELAPPLSLPALLRSAQPSGTFSAHLASSLKDALRLFRQDDYQNAVNCLKGKGFGSTPSGNDFLAGFLLALAWLDQSPKNRLSKIADLILYQSLGTDPLSDAFVRRSRALKPDADWVELLLAFRGGADPLPALRRVLSHGSTSGADALAGFFTALRQHSLKEVL